MGSFYNVCIYRIPKGVPLSFPPSHCFQCGQRIAWYDNLPLLSYWVRGGKCHHCKARFSSRYFFIELITALTFLGIFLRYCHRGEPYSLGFIPAIIFFSMLLIATFTDIDHWIIPDRISLGGAVVGIALAAIWPLGLAAHNPLNQSINLYDFPAKFLPLTNAVAGAIMGFLMLWGTGFFGKLIFRKEAMGMGDVKLALMFGAFVGPINCIFVFMLASFLGSIAGILSLILARMDRDVPVAAPVAALTPDAARCEQLVHERPLSPAEHLLVTRALTSPGPVGKLRHHLPFGPWLSLAAIVVYLAWEPIQKWFYYDLMGGY